MAARAVFLARLLAGEMPDEIEEAFEAASLRLFPARRGDLATTLLVPRHGEPVQAHRGRLLPARRVVRREPVPHLRVAGPIPRAADRRAARAAAVVGRSRPGGRVGLAAGSAAPRRGPAGAGSGAGPGGRSLAGFWDGGAAWAEVPIDARPTSPPDALLREADAEVVRALGGDTIAGLRGLYQRAAGAARRRLDPPGAAPPTASRRARNSRA